MSADQSSRFERISADICRLRDQVLVNEKFTCSLFPAADVPQKLASAAYHFRTPSPDGQRQFSTLSVFYIAQPCDGRELAFFSLSRGCELRHAAIVPTLSISEQTTDKGNGSWRSDRYSWHPSHVQRLRHVAIRRMNRRLLAARPVQGWRRSRMVTCLPERPSARRAICFTARTSQRAATDLTQPIFAVRPYRRTADTWTAAALWRRTAPGCLAGSIVQTRQPKPPTTRLQTWFAVGGPEGRGNRTCSIRS